MHYYVQVETYSLHAICLVKAQTVHDLSNWRHCATSYLVLKVAKKDFWIFLGLLAPHFAPPLPNKWLFKIKFSCATVFSFRTEPPAQQQQPEQLRAWSINLDSGVLKYYSMPLSTWPVNLGVQSVLCGTCLCILISAIYRWLLALCGRIPCPYKPAEEYSLKSNCANLGLGPIFFPWK